jgi:hypothetical protein
MRIRIRDIFALDQGWKNTDPGSGVNIPDPQHCKKRTLFDSNEYLGNGIVSN